MILSPDILFNSIIEVLLLEKELSVKELYTIIQKKHECSLPNFYKIVAQLCDKQILFKKKGKLSIHNRRAHTISYINGKLNQDRALESNIQSMKPGDTIIISKNSIRELDTVWMDAMDQIIDYYPEEQVRYFYNSHEYHILGMPETESQIFKKFTDYGAKDFYFLIGNESFLDQLSAELLKDCGCRVALSSKHPFASQGHFINVYGSHIVEVVFPIMLSHYLQAYYDKVADISQFDQQSFIKLFDFDIPIQLKINHDPVRADEYKKIIGSYF